MPVPTLVPANTLFFLCDIQTKFRALAPPSSSSPFSSAPETAIHGYDHVVATANKLIKLAKVRLSIPGARQCRSQCSMLDPGHWCRGDDPECQRQVVLCILHDLSIIQNEQHWDPSTRLLTCLRSGIS